MDGVFTPLTEGSAVKSVLRAFECATVVKGLSLKHSKARGHKFVRGAPPEIAQKTTNFIKCPVYSLRLHFHPPNWGFR